MALVKRPSTSLETTSKKLCQHENKEVQETADHELLQNIAENAEQLKLSLLPNEILLKIFKYLTPYELTSLAHLSDIRLSELTYSVREANFSACRTADPAFVSSFFSRDRVNLIEKLNFNYYFYLKPSELTSFICRCKNITSLSVVGCQLSFTQIYKILQNCRKLQKIAWNAVAIPKLDYDCFLNLKKLYLFYEYDCDHRVKSEFLKALPGLEEVWIDFDYDCNNSILPFVGMWSMVSSLTNEEKSKQMMIMATKHVCSSVTCSNYRYICENIIRQLFEKKDIEQLRSPDDLIHNIVSIPPYLQIQSDFEYLESVSLGPHKVYSTLVIDVTRAFSDVSESLIKFIQEVAGDKLEHLSFFVSDSKPFSIPVLLDPYTLYDYNCDKISYVMEQIFLTSKYITVLNLTIVHFTVNSPVKAITQLSHLKVLNLPSCAFRSNIRKNDSENLSSVVSACASISELVLYCCSESASVLTSNDLVCIQNWSCLKHLTVIYSIILRSFAFLQKVADSCIQLSSLSLIALGSGIASIFTNDVIYVLKKAKNLRFIRINDVNFNPMFERFWPAIGEAVGLEGICITTKSKVHITTKLVINAIKKLKYLHLFHFQANSPQCFYKEVKKSMQEQGIQNITYEEKCILANGQYLVSKQVEKYHRRPYLSECSRLHLKDIDLF